MKNFYIGDFLNAEEAKEPWDQYVKRKEREEQGQLKIWQKLILVAIYFSVFFMLYNYLKSTPLASENSANTS